MDASFWAALGLGVSVVGTGLALSYKIGGLVGGLQMQGNALSAQSEVLAEQGKTLMAQNTMLVKVATEVANLCERQDRVEKCLNGNLKLVS